MDSPRPFAKQFRRPGLFLFLTLGFLFIFIPMQVGAAGISVNSTVDNLTAGDGECTLREALVNANDDTDYTDGDCATGSGADVITLPAGTYALTLPGSGAGGGDLDIYDSVTISGADAATTVIDATAVSNRVISVNAETTLEALTLTGGSTAYSGGGISATEANLTLDGVIVVGNESDGEGGGIYMNTGTLTIFDSEIKDNTAVSNGGGIAIDFYGSSADVYDATISGNISDAEGGGIAVLGAGLTLTHSTVDGNVAAIGGGGIHNTNDGYTTIESSTISNNSAGDGFFTANVFGGGVKNVGVETSMSISNSTISGNNADDDGAGLYNNTGFIELTHTTVTDNNAVSEAGGVDNFGYVYVYNSIIAGNTDSGGTPDCRSLFGWPFTSEGVNLFGDGFSCAATVNDIVIDPAYIFTDVLESTLANNGGATFTHALLPDGPAVDTADFNYCTETDQRGIARPQSAGCDIGAFESADSPQPGPNFTVNVDTDEDDGQCTVTHCSLREAIQAANERVNDEESRDRIWFEIPEEYFVFISPLSPLPEITDPVEIDGFAGETYVIIDGSQATSEGDVDGLVIFAGDSVIHGLNVNNFSGHGILIEDNGGNLLEYNTLYGNGGDGVRVLDGVGNTISGNEISFNGGLAIDLEGDGVTPNDPGDVDTGVNDLTNAPTIIRVVPDGYEVRVEGLLKAAANTSYTIEFFENYSCDPAGYGEGEYFIGDVEVTTDSAGGATFDELLSLYGEGEGEGGYYNDAFITATATDSSGSTSEFSRCAPASPGNDSWPRALELPLQADELSPDVYSFTVSQFIDQQDQSRWFKFEVEPNSQLEITLTNLPENYDLTVYKDISATLQSLLNVDDNEDLALLTAEFAPDAFSPDAFSPDAFSPDAFSPDAFSPDAFSPDAFSPDAFSPDAFSPDAFSPDAFSPDAFSPDAFSPDAFSPDAFSPDAFSPDAFSPDAFSPDAFSSAQMRSLLGVSAYNGTAGEGIRLNTWENDGTFYVRVRGRNGVFSLDGAFNLDVTLTTGGCTAVSASLPASTHTPAAGGYNTIILADFSRMGDSTAELAALQAQLTTLAGRPDVNAVIVDVNGDARVAAANAQADANPACPYAKNQVAYAVKEIIDGYRAINPLQYIVIVGNDDVIPFFRHPDQALLANESNYAPPVQDNTPSQASLRLGYLLSQDRYGAALELSRGPDRLPLPGLPVGRLVETAADIMAQIDAYLATPNGVVPTPTSGFVTGYDFLEDAAYAVEAELAAGLGTAVDTLIVPRDLPPTDPSAWTADDLRAQLLNNRYDVTFLAGHFSAHSALAADYSTRLLASEIANSPLDMSNMLVFSAGCHSGYNIVNEHGVPGITVEPDWAQAFAQKGATLIAGTGYQYGDTDFIEYSERLYLEFSQNLREGTGPVAIGDALFAAKQEYLAETPELRPLHEKALLVSTIFGLPMMRIDMPAGRIPAPSNGSIVSGTTPFNTNPGNALGLTYADVTVNSSISVNQVVLDVIQSGAPDSTVTATYLSGNNGVVTNPAEPVLPLELRNVTVPGQTLRGIGFRGGSYSDLANVLPLTGAPTTEIRGVHPPFYTDTFYPVLPWQINYFDALMGSDAGATRLAFMPAQYRSSSPVSQTGTMRQFNDADFRLYYSSYTTTSAVSGISPAQAAPPAISNVTAELDGGILTVSARVVGNPAAGIQEVWITYTADSGPLAGQWQSLDLTQNAADSTLWEGTLNEAGSGNVQFIVQAVNGVGLVSTLTNLGAYFSATDEAPPAAPAATAVTLQSPPSSGAYSTVATVSAQLTSEGAPLANQPVVFSLGAQQRRGVTNGSGVATVSIPLLTNPGSAALQASFAGTSAYLPVQDTSPFTVTKQGTAVTLSPASSTVSDGETASFVATLTDAAGRALIEKTVIFIITGPSGTQYAAVITDFAGRAALNDLLLPVGSYTIDAIFGDVINATLDLTDDRYLPSTDTASLTVEAEATSDPLILVSTTTTLNIGDVIYQDEDILAFDIVNNSWELVFDGSDVGLSKVDLAAFAVMDDHSLLIAFDKKFNLDGVGRVTPNDIVRFVPTSLGEDTDGSWELYLDGGDVGLNTGAERIDAIAFDGNGRLLISTERKYRLPDLNGDPTDLIAFNATAFGEETAGSWELFFQGEAIGLNNSQNENLASATFDAAHNILYFTTSGHTTLADETIVRYGDVVGCMVSGFGDESACSGFQIWSGEDFVHQHIDIDGLWIE